MMKTRTCILCLLLAAACGGCTSDQLRYLAYLFSPGSQTETVKAEFPDLPGHTVAVVIYGGENVLYEYPYAPLRLSRRIEAELTEHVKKVKLVDSAAVLKYQEENIHWDTMDKTELGKLFNADYVLFVSLMEYTTREPNSVSLCRGRITAEASMYQTSLPEPQARVWNTASISTVFPEAAPTGLLPSEARRILDETERRFVDALVKKFYQHKEEVKL